MNIITRLFVLTSILVFVVACGGGSSPSSSSTSSSGGNTVSGVFLDSAVEGLNFSTSTTNGTTDKVGTFSYQPGEIVNFFIGDAFIGSAVGKSTVTPLDFIAEPDFTSPRLINPLRILQTLDTDSDATNGITLPTIAAEVGIDLDITNETSVTSFISTVDASLSLVSGVDALTHFSKTLSSLPPVSPPSDIKTIDYVFSHAYEGAYGSKIHTNLNAVLTWVDSKTINFSVTLPSGYVIDYTGAPITGYSTTDPSSIQYMSTSSTYARIVLKDPTTSAKFSVSFYNKLVENKTPAFCSGQTMWIDRIAVTSIIRNIGHEQWGCSDRGDYFTDLTLNVNYDGTSSTIQIMNNGLKIIKNNRDFVVATYEPPSLNGNRGLLIEKKDLTVQYTGTDSRGLTFTGRTMVISKAEQGAGKSPENNSVPETTYIANDVYRGHGSYTTDQYACTYDSLTMTFAISDTSGNVNNAVTGSYAFSGLKANMDSRCPASESASFTSINTGQFDSLSDFAFEFITQTGADQTCALDNVTGLLTCGTYSVIAWGDDENLDFFANYFTKL